MNGIDDIVQLVLLCAIIFIPVGYVLHRRLPNWLRTWQNLLLSPRYLKPAKRSGNKNVASQGEHKK
ncbi:cellulose biosynthesis protein BcsF [Serratia sp. DD3]|uniref:cellulose biosynthesis protein BcsF n=1 Tax=Serratia sp. DD3 TaxID=1410619 RepID=UPI0003C507B7|nr:cellulose biosynthesis protein BcsF [Serratia sp. DD3]KEY60466.1 celllulose biosynthesis operon protein BcsF/YhjT [Serratia sp. DD3]